MARARVRATQSEGEGRGSRARMTQSEGEGYLHRLHRFGRLGNQRVELGVKVVVELRGLVVEAEVGGHGLDLSLDLGLDALAGKALYRQVTVGLLGLLNAGGRGRCRSSEACHESLLEVRGGQL